MKIKMAKDGERSSMTSFNIGNNGTNFIEREAGSLEGTKTQGILRMCYGGMKMLMEPLRYGLDQRLFPNDREGTVRERMEDKAIGKSGYKTEFPHF